MYTGFVVVERDVVEQLTGQGGGARLLQAGISAGGLRLAWLDGRTAAVPWPQIKAMLALDDLPPPSTAFVGDHGEVGLMFSSNHAHGLLRYREPHSVVMPIGRLTASGFQPA